MAQVKLEWVTNKHIDSLDKDILEVSFTENGVTKDATIWEFDKDGKQFPNFKTLKAGDTIDCIVYVKSDGKITLYPPRQDNKPPMRGAGAITKAMEKKAESIAVAQGNKEHGIMTSSTIRMAVDIALAEIQGLPFDVGVFKSRVKEWRNWLIAEWDNTGDATPFN